MFKVHGALVAAPLFLIGCASSAVYAGPSEKVAATLAKYERTGETEACLSIASIDSIRPLDERHFLVQTALNSYYLNQPSSGCSSAGRANHRIQYVLGNAQLCRNQIITVLDNTTGITAGSCGLGSFEKLEKKSEDAD